MVKAVIYLRNFFRRRETTAILLHRHVKFSCKVSKKKKKRGKVKLKTDITSNSRDKTQYIVKKLITFAVHW